MREYNSKREGGDFISLKKMNFLYLLKGAPKGPDSSVKPLFRRRDASRA
jgi:hypothetical protein